MNKSEKAFLAIGVDHALEQVNRELKAVTGITGLPNEAIDIHCYTIPVKHALLANFSQEFGIDASDSASPELHHEDSGSFNEFYVNSIKSYSNGLREYLVDDWEEYDTVFNVMTT